MKRKVTYSIDAFKWFPRKDGSGNDKCYTDDVHVKTLFGLCWNIIKFLLKNDGIIVCKSERSKYYEN